MAYDVKVINELVQRESAFTDKLINEVGKVIVGPARKPTHAIRLGAAPGQDDHGHVRIDTRCEPVGAADAVEHVQSARPCLERQVQLFS